jgi:hypothetical protein
VTIEPVIDAEIADLTESEAQEITGRIRTWVREFPAEDVERAYFGRIWLALGYESWDEWCDCELGGFRLRLPIDERRDVVAGLAESGMSNTSIADVIGVSEGTVRNDHKASGSQNYEPVTGQDGKKYKCKPRPAPEIADGAEKSRAALNGFVTMLKAAVIEARQVTTLDFLTAEEAKALFPTLDEFPEHYRSLADRIVYRAVHGQE